MKRMQKIACIAAFAVAFVNAPAFAQGVDDEIPEGLSGDSPPPTAQDLPDDAPPAGADVPLDEPLGDPAPTDSGATSESEAATDSGASAAEDTQTQGGTSSGRPAAPWSLGIGAGWRLPSEIDMPDIASARLFLGQVRVEGTVDLGVTSTSNDSGGISNDNSALDFIVGAGAAMVLAERGPVGLVAGGAATIGFGSTDPEGPDNGSSRFLFGLNWIVGLEYWITERWVLGGHIVNPLFGYNTTTQETGGGTETTSSSFDFGLIFDPKAQVMIHLVF